MGSERGGSRWEAGVEGKAGRLRGGAREALTQA